MLAKKGFFNKTTIVNNFFIWLKKKKKKRKKKVFPRDEQFIVGPRIASLSNEFHREIF